jgi:hypothetical protein
LIRLGLAFRVLDIDARVASPRDFKNGMAAAALPWLAEVGRAYLFEVTEPLLAGLQTHLFQKFFKVHQMDKMVPLLAPLVESGKREWGQAHLKRDIDIVVKPARRGAVAGAGCRVNVVFG